MLIQIEKELTYESFALGVRRDVRNPTSGRFLDRNNNGVKHGVAKAARNIYPERMLGHIGGQGAAVGAVQSTVINLS